MKAVKALPEGYREIYTLDLQKDKKMLILVNLLAIAIFVLMAVPMSWLVPVYTLFGAQGDMGDFNLKMGAVLVLLVLYMVLHELVHGIAMKMCGTEKVRYGFTGMYAFACSDDYYNKKAYIFIALAPIVLWGVVLAVINLLVPLEWFWVFYFIQIGNISGAAGDLFVTLRFWGFPEDMLVKDYGVGMTVYSRK